MELIVCFIDDSRFEHALVKEIIAPVNPSLKFIQTYTFEEARVLLNGKIPILFLLDLWGQDPAVLKPCISPIDILVEKSSRFKSLEEVYYGLEEFPGDKINEYLKRLFSIVEGWRGLFEEVCDNAGQNRKYGLENLRLVREYYPGVPAVFYTRKSLINDAVAMVRSGIDGLFIKPTGRDDAETRILTSEYAPDLINQLSEIIDKNINKLMQYASLYNPNEKENHLMIEELITSWNEFIKK